MKKIKLFATALQNFLPHQRTLAIFMHRDPDPDALASAFILRAIAKHFNVKATIFLDGQPNQKENYTMINLLKIPLKPQSTYNGKTYEITALVDCQLAMKNHNFPAPRVPDITIDHHTLQKKIRAPAQTLIILQPNIGATASLLMQIFLILKLKLTTQLATAYAYALLSETRYLSREFSPYDIAVYKQIVPKINFTTMASIQNTKRPRLFYTIMQNALKQMRIRNNIITCPLGNVASLDYIHQIAEELVKMEGVFLVMVTGTTLLNSERPHTPSSTLTPLGKISLRSEHPALELGKWLKQAIKPYGSGGGHRMIAAGNFLGSEQRLLRHVETYIQNRISQRLRTTILNDLAINQA